ncbi:MAG TPA: Maf family protein [Methylophilus sp.]|nr:Maf family protein [Methylophilus sp.]
MLAMMKRIILASQSPRRLQLLSQIGVEGIVQPADVDESELPNESPKNYVLRLAIAKVQAISAMHADELKMPILAADTTVALTGHIFGKPQDDSDAAAMLRTFSGCTHEVHTAIAVATPKRILNAVNTTQVTFCALSDAMIAAYIATGEHRDKAGSYGIQGYAGAWVQHIAGSYTGVMGLPLYETAQLLTLAQPDFE